MALGGFTEGKSTTFALDVSRWAAKARGRADLVVRKVSLDVFSRVIKRTPVDTGRARGNWQASIGAQAVGEVATTDKSGASTVAAAQAVTSQAKAGDVVWLINNVPYIRRLETGWSKQAPAG